MKNWALQLTPSRRLATLLVAHGVVALGFLTLGLLACSEPNDVDYAVSFVIPIGAPGLKLLSRRSYEASATSEFDAPLASKYDENDAVLYFDDVLVPWERVFVDRDTSMTLAQFHDTPAHVYQNYQAQIRLAVKMKFLVGLAHRIASTNGLFAIPQVRETPQCIGPDFLLGRLGGTARSLRGLSQRREVGGE